MTNISTTSRYQHHLGVTIRANEVTSKMVHSLLKGIRKSKKLYLTESPLTAPRRLVGGKMYVLGNSWMSNGT